LLEIGYVNKFLFDRTRDPENVRSILKSIYVNPERVDDELVESIVKPSRDAGASNVFQST
jgi:hypothetical protein